MTVIRKMLIFKNEEEKLVLTRMCCHTLHDASASCPGFHLWTLTYWIPGYRSPCWPVRREESRICRLRRLMSLFCKELWPLACIVCSSLWHFRQWMRHSLHTHPIPVPRRKKSVCQIGHITLTNFNLFSGNFMG